jgi:hypothetical protein
MTTRNATLETFPSGAHQTSGFWREDLTGILQAHTFDLDSTITAAASSLSTFAKAIADSRPTSVVVKNPRETLPQPLRDAVDHLNHLLNARANWNSYGAAVPAVRAVVGALRLLARISFADKPMPSIVPTVSGGVQLEWHRLGRDLEIVVRPDESLYAFFEDEQTGETFESAVAPGSPALSRFLELATAPLR